MFTQLGQGLFSLVRRVCTGSLFGLPLYPSLGAAFEEMFLRNGTMDFGHVSTSKIAGTAASVLVPAIVVLLLWVGAMVYTYVWMCTQCCSTPPQEEEEWHCCQTDCWTDLGPKAGCVCVCCRVFAVAAMVSMAMLPKNFTSMNESLSPFKKAYGELPEYVQLLQKCVSLRLLPISHFIFCLLAIGWMAAEEELFAGLKAVVTLCETELPTVSFSNFAQLLNDSISHIKESALHLHFCGR
ncbi:uncharacterized protein MONOS_16556 [Monocercomonoides exilis]|uniref:uncharacterized protein n=1 Tax=Monocercomonoides exilis TaxID=2049356 RepID=UPI003559C71A|nr:hypothetical protein MONOS_16556 [Monocercomonoides exilis]|eukprot:MONOS_16556.1-p1 / transcript=MONOS_16556.1 / gene=MONOS_16556 / organism=Monocercomonoides_exilis_PA203 / gene_product=unspecified product / transcript_product=unspecified product / location=Mono_scaffold01859:2879-3799(-) / protein_length=239 / sequence_SO=supercontig / SO=protein_coding / is_pseudo=false